MYQYLDCFDHLEGCLGLLHPVFACEILSAVGRTIGLAEELEDEEGSGVLACPVSLDTASSVVLRGGVVGVVEVGTYQEEAVACLVGAVEQHREGMEDTFRVETSVLWVSCRAACSGPCKADPVACLEGMALAFLEGLVTEDRAEMGEVQSGCCDSGCGRTKGQEDPQSRIGWRRLDHVQGGS